MRLRSLSAVVLLGFLFCVGAEAQETPAYVLHGTLVTPDIVMTNGGILVSGEKIKALGTNMISPPGAHVIETDSFIFPGLIDLHDHLTWNLFPRWAPRTFFLNRYEWQQLGTYKTALNTPHRLLFEEKLGCEMNRYGEVKAITQGATSLVGSLAPTPGTNDNDCIEGLARNLDFYSGLYKPGVVNTEKLRYEVFPFQLSLADSVSILDKLTDGRLSAFVIHVGEGTDASSNREFQILQAQGFLRPGVVIIHGVALTGIQFDAMAKNGVGLIWSPHSNIEFYGTTSDVAEAKRHCVKIALAPDWSPSGSNGMLEELKYAASWNESQTPKVFDEKDLVKMATTYPAQLAGLADKIGTLAPGLFADLLILKRRENDPYKALLHAGLSDVRLVVIGGSPVYGDPELMQMLLPGRQFEQLTVCGEKKAMYLGGQSGLQGVLSKTWVETSEKLASALNKWGISLAPLADCR